jgi:type VI secretion system secreted protein Hcp
LLTEAQAQPINKKKQKVNVMAVDMFLKLDGVKGESKDEAHKQEIDVLAWSWGMSNNGSAHQGAGAGSGKVSVRDITLTKYVDSSSPKIMLSCCDGEHFDTAKLTVRKAGGKAPVEYIVIKMEEVLISSVSTGGSGAEDRLTENVNLNFAKVSLDCTPQGDKGEKGTAIPFSWNIAANANQ